MATNVRVINEVDVDVNELPTVDVDVIDLPTVDVDVNSLPDLKITEIGPMGPLTLDGIPDHYTVNIASLPDLNLRIKEIPSIRAHIPASFRLGFSILGVELAALNLCGEAQVITEPYVPNPCERCGAPRSTNVQQPNDVAAVLRLKNQG